MLMRTTTEPTRTHRRNMLMSGMDVEDRMRLERAGHVVEVRRGDCLMRQGDPIRHMLFPETCLVSIIDTDHDGRCIETAIVGSEGFLGWSALLGCRAAPHDALAQMKTGHALWIPIDEMSSAYRESEGLRNVLGAYMHTVMMQMAHSMGCRTWDALPQRLARWLLMRHDRMIGDVMRIRHDDIALSLNVRRASVTEGMHHLEGERLVVSGRGSISIRDRSALAAYAGASYGRAEAAYSRMLSPFGKDADFVDGHANLPMSAGNSVSA